MNENIHAIHSKAFDLAYKTACEKNKVSSPQHHTVFNEYVVIFAEMLIKECARISEDCDCTMTNQGHAAAEEMKSHFGID